MKKRAHVVRCWRRQRAKSSRQRLGEQGEVVDAIGGVGKVVGAVDKRAQVNKIVDRMQATSRQRHERVIEGQSSNVTPWQDINTVDERGQVVDAVE